MTELLRIALVIQFNSEYGYNLIASIKSFTGWPGPVSFRRMDPVSRAQAWPAISVWKPHGAICEMADAKSTTYLRLRMPVVNVEWSLDGCVPPEVGLDCQATAQQAVAYLAGLGYRTIAYMGWGEEYYRRPLADAAHAAGLEFRSFAMDLGWPVPAGTSVWLSKGEQIAAWVRDLPKPVGIVCVRDFDAAALSDYCADACLPVPDEVGILGIGNMAALCSLSRPHLSSIHIPAREIGLEAARRLSEILAGRSKGHEPLLLPPVRIVERESTIRTGTSDPATRKAVRFIRENAVRGIAVRDITRHVGISRTNLDLRLKQVLGRPAGASLRAIRLDAAKRMIVESEFPMREVARLCGYSTSQYFIKAFRKGTGVSPGAYRRRHRADPLDGRLGQ